MKEAALPDRYITKHLKGWAANVPSSERAGSLHSTNREAEQAAKQKVRNLGCGEVRIQGSDSRWRNSDAVPPGTDPKPPRVKKHLERNRSGRSRSRGRQLQSDVPGIAEESLKTNSPLIRHSHILPGRPVV